MRSWRAFASDDPSEPSISILTITDDPTAVARSSSQVTMMSSAQV